jgi:acetyl esterase/lipase
MKRSFGINSRSRILRDVDPKRLTTQLGDVARFAAALLFAPLIAPAQTLPPHYRATNNVPYVTGGQSRQWMDLYYVPSNATPTPVVVWIHGGGWNSGNEANPRALALTNFNIAVAAITHRFTTNAPVSGYPTNLPHPAQIQDVKSAIRWLRANAVQFNLDPDRIGMWGFSSGGHLSALTGTTGHTNIFDVGEHLGQSSRVQAVVDMSGPTDLLQSPTTVPGFDYDLWLLGDQASNNPPTLATVNPINFIRPDATPFRIVHGEVDPNVNILSSELLHTALTNAGVSSTFIRLPGVGHTIPANQDGPAALWLSEMLNGITNTPLVVSNHSFEFPVIAADTFATASPPPGWQVYGSNLNFGGRTIGVLHRATTTLYIEPTPHGSNVGVIFLLDNQANQTNFANMEAGMRQTLAATLQTLRQYTLTVEVGNIGNDVNAPFLFGGFPNYRIDLLAGSNVIASDLNTLLPGEGRFLTSTVTVSIPAVHPNLGQQLGIRLVNLNNAPGIEVNFDNVRLSYGPLIPPLLDITRAANDFQLAWPLWAGNYALESATALAMPTLWSAVTNPPTTNGALRTVFVSGATNQGYFRLRLTNAP